MASSRNKFFSGGKLSNKSSGSSGGLRILWLPGRHKKHSKGSFDSTHKQLGHKSGQKKNEIWSLGGTKNQRDLIDADPDSSLFDGPSVSGISSAACALDIVSAEKCTTAAPTKATTTTPIITVSAAGEDGNNKNIDGGGLTYDATNTNTPSSTASTTPLISVPNSPDTGATPKLQILTTTRTTEAVTTNTAESSNKGNNNDIVLSMPAKTTLTTVTTTTTAEIMDANRLSILGKDTSNEIDVYDLPSPPKNGHITPPSEKASTNVLLNASTGTTASTATTPSPSISPKQHNGRDSMTASPTKKKAHHKNENNNHQNDINSIETISDNTKIPSSNLDWVDEYLPERNSNELLSKKKKKKKKISSAKELDQLDGVPSKHNTKEEINDDENDKVVNCLYYTLMCCECTIS